MNNLILKDLLKDLKLFVMELLHISLYWLAARVSVDEKIWIFGSWLGMAYNDNSKYLFEYVQKNFPDVKAIWFSRKKEIVRDLRSRGFKAYHFYSPMGIWYAMKAGIVIFSLGYSGDLPGFCMSSSKKKIQLWHGAFLKKFGVLNTNLKDTNQRNFPYLKSRYFRKSILFIYNRLFHAYATHESVMEFKLELYHTYSLITASSRLVKKEYIECFSVPKEETQKVIVTGFPRNDILIKPGQNKQITSNPKRKKIASIINQIHNGKGFVGFYLPTHRQEGEEYILEEIVSGLKQAQGLIEKHNIHIMIKLHQFHQHETSSEDLKNVYFITEDDIDNDVYPLLPLTDFLITDYSGVFFEYLLVNKPIIFLNYDFKHYKNFDRDFYFPYNKVTPGPKVRSWKKLAQIIERELKKDSYKKERKKIKKLFHKYSDGNNSQRIANFLHKTLITNSY